MLDMIYKISPRCHLISILKFKISQNLIFQPIFISKISFIFTALLDFKSKI